MIRYYFLDVGSFTPSVQPLKQVPIIPIAMAAASIGSSIYNTLSGKATNKKALENQDKLYAQQKAQQDYLNANGALIKRQSMERAGLNPNADYGYSPNLTASTPTPAQLSAPQFNMDMSSIVPMLQLMQNKPLVRAQVEKTEAERDELLSRIPQNQARTQEIIQNTSNLLEQNGILKFENQTQQEKFDKSMANLYANTQFQKSQKQVSDWDADLKQIEWELFDQTFDERKQTYFETLNNIIADNDLKDSEKKLNIQRVNESVANVAFTQAQIRRMEKLLEPEFQKLTNEANVAKQQASFIIAQASMVRTENQWYEFRMMCESLGLSKRVVETLGKFTPLRKYMPKKYKSSGVR